MYKKRALLGIGLSAALFAATVFAQGEGDVVRKVTISLHAVPAIAPIPAQDHGDKAALVVRKANDNLLAEATVLRVEPVMARLPKIRHFDYSEDHIVIVGFAADSTERTRTVMIDPRLVRVEALRGEKDLTSNRLYRQTVDFSILLDDSSVVRVQILKPRWDGSEWLFDPVAEVQLQ